MSKQAPCAAGMRGDCVRGSSACRRQVRPWSRMQAPSSRPLVSSTLHYPSGEGLSGHTSRRPANALGSRQEQFGSGKFSSEAQA